MGTEITAMCWKKTLKISVQCKHEADILMEAVWYLCTLLAKYLLSQYLEPLRLLKIECSLMILRFNICGCNNCTARQCSPLLRKFMECYIINPTLSLLMKHLVIGQRQKAPNFSAFHWSPHGSLVSIGQHFVATRVVFLPKRTETSIITESDQRASNH